MIVGNFSQQPSSMNLALEMQYDPKSVIGAGFFGWAIQKMFGACFSGAGAKFCLWVTPEIWGNLPKVCFKIIKQMKN